MSSYASWTCPHLSTVASTSLCTPSSLVHRHIPQLLDFEHICDYWAAPDGCRNHGHDIYLAGNILAPSAFRGMPATLHRKGWRNSSHDRSHGMQRFRASSRVASTPTLRLSQHIPQTLQAFPPPRRTPACTEIAPQTHHKRLGQFKLRPSMYYAHVRHQSHIG
ncbi:hypothetical protein BD311DRAFT_46526 [Dichomitus squalens]|uniref:Uncharacterized protein n=1 Tax=Dichomitus squalens TaxID=114155 RepID=A0A4Q9MA83_9APHY|nr:hypothetical protein BD311DRAFT_46526 [Dichomitus squalens]